MCFTQMKELTGVEWPDSLGGRAPDCELSFTKWRCSGTCSSTLTGVEPAIGTLLGQERGWSWTLWRRVRLPRS